MKADLRHVDGEKKQRKNRVVYHVLKTYTNWFKNIHIYVQHVTLKN
jgi:hypothetical protein